MAIRLVGFLFRLKPTPRLKGPQVRPGTSYAGKGFTVTVRHVRRLRTSYLSLFLA